MRVKIQNSCEQLGVDGVSGSDMFDALAVAISLLDKKTETRVQMELPAPCLMPAGHSFLRRM